jgi:hypothetical protein
LTASRSNVVLTTTICNCWFAKAVMIDAISYAWTHCNPRVPVPVELQRGPATLEDAQPNPVQAERNREYQRQYQRRRRRSGSRG